MWYQKGVFRWIPAILVMSIIYLVSSQPSAQLPQFGLVDVLVKKGSHMIGYATLAWAYAYALDGVGRRRLWWTFGLAVLYALTDEYHQTFVPGRNGSLWDVGIDALGAGLALWRLSKNNDPKP